MLNRDIGPWGPLELRMSARFWSAKETISFSQLLDIVEEGLRSSTAPLAEEMSSRKTVNAAEKR
jgi:hypothetical protein